MNKTIAIIKPDAVANGQSEKIIRDIEFACFWVNRRVVTVLDRADAEALYKEHRRRDHFNDLVDFTISGPVEILDLQSSNTDIVKEFRKLMGPTNLTDAGPETLRHKYATDFRRNAIHGSDSIENAAREAVLLEHYFGQ